MGGIMPPPLEPREKVARGKKRFLACYGKTGQFMLSCGDSRIDKTTIMEWQDDDPDFAAAVRAVPGMVNERLERRAITRATTKSDQLLWRLLQARMPETYAPPQQHQHQHEGTLTLAQMTPEALRALSTDELQTLRSLVRKLRGDSPTTINVTPDPEAEPLDVAGAIEAQTRS